MARWDEARYLLYRRGLPGIVDKEARGVVACRASRDAVKAV